MSKPIDFTASNMVCKSLDRNIGDLPCFVEGNIAISCWELTDEEIAYIVKHRHVWLSQLNFGKPLQPQKVWGEYPFENTTTVGEA